MTHSAANESEGRVGGMPTGRAAYCTACGRGVTAAVPRTIYVKVSTELLAESAEWSEPLRVRIERQPDDTYEMTFKREEAS